MPPHRMQKTEIEREVVQRPLCEHRRRLQARAQAFIEGGAGFDGTAFHIVEISLSGLHN